MKHLITTLLFMTFFLVSKAQEVGSTAFDIILKGLLSHTVNEVSVQDVKGKTEILFVDAREESEYKVSHIKDAVFVGYDNLDLSDLEKVDRNKEVVVYCSVGYRSEKVAEKLLEMGFSNVSNLYGGLFEWKNQEQVIVNLKNEPTDKIHAFNKVWEIWLKKGEKVY
jgi:rhodanese-related sulfurtransferase